MGTYAQRRIRGLASGLLWFVLAATLTLGLFVGICVNASTSDDEPSGLVNQSISVDQPKSSVVALGANPAVDHSGTFASAVQQHLLSGPAIMSYAVSLCVLIVATFFHRLRKSFH